MELSKTQNCRDLEITHTSPGPSPSRPVGPRRRRRSVVVVVVVVVGGGSGRGAAVDERCRGLQGAARGEKTVEVRHRADSLFFLAKVVY